MTVEDAIRQGNALIDDGHLRDATALIEGALAHHPEDQQSLLYCLLCIASIAKDKAAVLALFRRSRQSGVWWSPDLIRRDDDFRWLLDDGEFKTALNELETTAARHRATSRAVALDLVHGDRHRWIVNLHKRNNSNIRMLRYFEDANARLGRRTRYIQSSQVTSSDGYSWNNIETALAEVRELAGGLADAAPIVTGTSQGGNVAFLHALATGADYLGVMPALTDESLVGLSRAPIGTMVFLVGDNDPVRGNAVEAHARIRALGGSTSWISLGPVGHWLPEDFSDHYEHALARLEAP